MTNRNFVFFLAAFFALVSPSFADASSQTRENFVEYALQNGMRVFVLEDFSTATVRLEYAARAGLAAQTPETARFFQLYSRLFLEAGKTAFPNEHAEWLLSNASAECVADSARYILTVAPRQIERALSEFFYCAAHPVFSDEAIDTQFSALKEETLAYSQSVAGFVNATIDARVFADSPWRQKARANPAIFSDMLPAQVRAILLNIARTCYTPQTSALFISGGISKETALFFAEKTFGAWQTSGGLESNTELKINNSARRKFVIADSRFSSDIAQIAVQYTSLSAIEADMLAVIFNANNSTFKRDALSQKMLGIRGADYINVAAAHKSGTSRLVFQSLLEKMNAPSSLSPIEQAETFLHCIKAAASNIVDTEVTTARENLISAFWERSGSSTWLMERLSELWATEPSSREAAPLIERLYVRPDEIINLDMRETKRAYNAEEPFVFVLVNDALYREHAAHFKAAGYELATQENDAWYAQEINKNTTDNDAEIEHKNLTTENATAENTADSVSRFIEKNLATLSTFKLANGIPVALKQNPASNSALLLVSISGGKLSDEVNPGFFSILLNALADNIQKEIYAQKSRGTIDGSPQIHVETNLTSGAISIESLSDDIAVVASCVSRAIIYGDIQPAQADGLVYNARMQKRLYNGGLKNQLQSRAVRELFPQTTYVQAFDSENEILAQIQYSDFRKAYPSLLDAARYNVIVVGKFRAEIIQNALESSLGMLSAQTEREAHVASISSPQFPQSKRIDVNLRHLFLTDTRAENTGERPPVLVPTTNFSDPVQYWIPAPDDANKRTLFNALLYVLQKRLANEIAKISTDIKVDVDAANHAMNAACITINHVDSTNQIDKLYEDVAARLCADAENDEAFSRLKEEIVNEWALQTLSESGTNMGTAHLIYEGLEEGRIAQRCARKSEGDGREQDESGATDMAYHEYDMAQFERDAKNYLTRYALVDTVTHEEIAALCQKYFSALAPLRLYSKDAGR